MVELDTTLLWKSHPDFDSKRLETRDVRIRNVDVGAQYVVSGAYAKAAAKAGVEPEGAGALGLVTGRRYALRLARERFLIVSEDAAALSSGWHEDGYAVTEMSGALVVFEFSGTGAIEIVKRATTLSLDAPGPCAAVSFADVAGCLYRSGAEDCFRLHVDRGLAPYLWEWFETLYGLTPPAAPRI
jgi:heterotetrameric sarcosine oxidase gamma subunit